MVMTMLVLLLAAAAVLWLQAPAKPQPVRSTRRDLRREELFAAYLDQQDSNRRW